MKKIILIVLAVVTTLTFNACKKEAGEGGNSSIKGKIWVEDYNSTFTTLQAQYAGADEDVYIIYGDNTSYGNKIKASPDGSFEFKYLRKGNYTIYVYSKDKTLTSPSGKVTVKVNATISKKKETVDVGKITIYN
jgi:hypothetical protein